MNFKSITASGFCYGRAMAALLVFALVGVPRDASAQPSSTPREDFWVNNDGVINAMAEANGILYVGGSFRSIGPATGRGAVVDLSSGAVSTALPAINGRISAVADDGVGGWYIAGDFTSIDAVSRDGLARIRHDHSLDPDWKPPKFRSVNRYPIASIAVAGNTVFIGGLFWRVEDPVPQFAPLDRANLAALDSVTGKLTDWKSPFVTSHASQVQKLAVSGDRLFVLGVDDPLAFGWGLAAVDVQTGRVLPWNPISSSTRKNQGFSLWDFSVTCDTVYVAGGFTNVNGQARNKLAAFSVATGELTAWNPNPTGGDFRGNSLYRIKRVVAHDNVVYVTGWFDRIGGQPRTDFAALDGAFGKALDWNPNPTLPAAPVGVSFAGSPPNDPSVSEIAVSGNTVYVIGRFNVIGGQARNGLAALDALTGRATSWQPSVSGSLELLAPSGNSIFVTGPLSVGAQLRQNLAAIDMVTGRATDWNPTPYGNVRALKVFKDKLYVAGDFTNVAGQARNRLAAFDLNTGKLTDWNPNAELFPDFTNPIPAEITLLPYVQYLDFSTNVAYVGGYFSHIGGQYGGGAVDLTTGKATDWKPKLIDFGGGGPFAVSEKAIYVDIGGSFTNVNGQVRDGLAAFDLDTGSLLPWNPGPGPKGGSPFGPLIEALALWQNRLYVAGSFTNICGKPRNGLAAIDAITGECLDWNPNANPLDMRPGFIYYTPTIYELCVSSNTVYVAGSFERIGGQIRRGLAALDPVTGQATDWNPMTDLFDGRRILQFGNSVIASGNFTEVGGRYRPNLAVFPPAGSPVVIQQPQNRTAGPGETVTLSVSVAGDAPFFYQWQFNGTNLLRATNSTLVLTNLQAANSGLYSVLVTNRLGPINSAEARVTVLVPPSILSQPSSQTVAPGATVTLEVKATGNPPSRYQWRLNGVNIPKPSEPTLTLTNLQPTDGGSYSVGVVNAGGSVNSDIAELVVFSPRLPFTDNVRDRAVTNSFEGVGSGNSTNATREAGEPDHVGKPGRKSFWLGWRAPASGVATFSTRGSGFDTLLVVYTNAVPTGPLDFTNLRAVAADDDRGGFLTSEVVFSAVAGIEYLIVVDGFGKSSGNIVLSWKLDTAISDAPRIFQQPLSTTAGPGQTVTLSVAAFSTRPLTYVWIQNCEVILGATNATLVVTNVQAGRVGRYIVFVNNGSQAIESAPAFLEINFSGDAGTLQKVASRDKLADRGVIGVAAAQAFNSPGNRALLSTVNRNSQRDLELLSPGFGGAPARGFVGTQIFHTFGNTKELGEPNHAGEPGGASAWYSVLAEEDGKMLVSTEGSDFDTVVAVYEGPPNPLGYDELVMPAVAADNNRGFDRKSSRVIFGAARNHTYHIAVDGVSGVQGQVVLTYQLGSAPELTAQPVSGVWKVGNVVILVIQVRSRVPVDYQWRYNGLALAGATNATLVIPIFQFSNAGQYICEVSNFAGAVASTEAMLQVSEGVRLQASGFDADGNFRLLLSGELGPKTVIQASINLINWLPIFTNPAPNRSIEFLDRDAVKHRLRFYRAAE